MGNDSHVFEKCKGAQSRPADMLIRVLEKRQGPVLDPFAARGLESREPHTAEVRTRMPGQFLEEGDEGSSLVVILDPEEELLELQHTHLLGRVLEEGDDVAPEAIVFSSQGESPLSAGDPVGMDVFDGMVATQATEGVGDADAVKTKATQDGPQGNSCSQMACGTDTG